MEEHVVSRRSTLKYFSLLAGTEAGRAFLSQWLPGDVKALADPCQQQAHVDDGARIDESSDPDYHPTFFKPEEFSVVQILTEMVIPTDEKPGAREAHVANYIDFLMASASEFKPELQKQWIEGLKLLNDLSQRKYASSFRELSPVQREALLTEISLPEQRAWADNSDSTFYATRPHLHPSASVNHQADDPAFNFYRLVKVMTVEAFYTSRVGLMDVLDYKGLAIMSSFPGCTHPEHH